MEIISPELLKLTSSIMYEVKAAGIARAQEFDGQSNVYAWRNSMAAKFEAALLNARSKNLQVAPPDKKCIQQVINLARKAEPRTNFSCLYYTMMDVIKLHHRAALEPERQQAIFAEISEIIQRNLSEQNATLGAVAAR